MKKIQNSVNKRQRTPKGQSNMDNEPATYILHKTVEQQSKNTTCVGHHYILSFRALYPDYE